MYESGDAPKGKHEEFDSLEYLVDEGKAHELIWNALKEENAYMVGSRDAIRIYRIACKKVEDETHQAMEALVHNLNTLHSRAGAQVPFSSINYGLCTSPAGRLVIQETLNAVYEGLGHGETAIFPISVFQLKAGVNYNPGDPNYDLFQRACEVSAKRLFPKQNWGLAA